MHGFAFQVACLRLEANEPLFGIYIMIMFSGKVGHKGPR